MSDLSGFNRTYRDRLFKFIFGNPEKKEWTLSLYNAINGSHYTNADDIEINTIDDVVYMGMKNDVSFLIDNTLNLYEQQSTYNPNMPMRFLIYAGMLYSKYIETNPSYHRFSCNQQYAPTPKCVCFYNGDKDKDDRTILNLTDGFSNKTKSDIDLRVTMININYGHNAQLLNSCKPLDDYSFFVDKIRDYQKRMTNVSNAVDRALSDLPDNSVIKSFLLANKAEVKNMCITEYDEVKAIADWKEEAMAEGRAEGIINTLRDLVKDGILTPSDAAARSGANISEFENLR